MFKTTLRTLAFCSCALLGAMPPLAAQDDASSAQTWTGQFSGTRANELLRYQDGSFYLSTSGDGEAPDWRPVGTTAGYSVGKGGFYVADLEGTGQRSTIAFFDPQQQTWLWGAIDGNGVLTWTPVGKNVNGRTMFHVGDGPFFAPIDQVEDGPPRDTGSPLRAHMTYGPSAPLSFPVVGTQKTNLASSQHMETTVVIFQSGDSYATTHVREDTALAGFHGGVLLAFFADDGRTILWTQKQGPIGVTGRWFGHSDVTVSSYLGKVPSNILPLVKRYAIAHMWEPQWLTALKDIKGFFDVLVGIVNDTIGIVKAFLPAGNH